MRRRRGICMKIKNGIRALLPDPTASLPVAVHPYCGQVRHSRKVWGFLPRHGDESDFLKNRCANHEENSLPPRFLVLRSPDPAGLFPAFLFGIPDPRRAIHDELALSFCQNKSLRSGGDDQSLVFDDRILIRLRLCAASVTFSTERDPSAPRNLLHPGNSGRWLRKNGTSRS